jgi:hypothetical protein
MNATNGNGGINNNTGINNTGINNNIGVDLMELLERLGQYFIENIVAICTMVVIIIGALVYQQIMYVQHGVDISGSDRTGKPAQTVVVEPFLPGSDPDAADSLDAKLKAGFCKSYLGKPAELETECGKMSKNSCTATSCCVWARMGSAESCVSGNEYGPIFKNNPNGSPKPLDYYYFENKCSGNCPNP